LRPERVPLDGIREVAQRLPTSAPNACLRFDGALVLRQ